MTVDEAIKELLSISTDLRAVAIVSADGALLASGPGDAGSEVGAAGGRLWEAAARRASSAGDSPLEHVVVDIGGASVAIVASGARRIIGLTGPESPVGLVLFDLRTCLTDAFPSEAGATSEADASAGAFSASAEDSAEADASGPGDTDEGSGA